MGQVSQNKRLFVEYCLLIFVILWSGGSFTYGTFTRWPYVMTVVAGIISLKRGITIDRNAWWVIGLFAIVTVAQMVIFDGVFTSIAAPILSIVSIALIATIVRSNFSHIFVRIVAVFALLSLVFWIIDLFPEGHNILLEIAKELPQLGAENFENTEGCAWVANQNYTLYFYSVSESVGQFDLFARNPGPFYEPGRFTIVLTMAMAIILFGREYKNNKFLFYVILAANISTFSATGYFSMLILFVCFSISNYQENISKAIITSFIIIIVAYYVFQTSFVSEKILEALATTDEANTRFGAMIYHWSQIVQSPFIGFGIYLESALGETELSPCGTTEMMRHWGIPMFIFCVFKLYGSAKSLLKNDKFLSFAFALIMLTLAYTQTIMDAPLFYLFYLLGGKPTNETVGNSYGGKF